MSYQYTNTKARQKEKKLTDQNVLVSGNGSGVGVINGNEDDIGGGRIENGRGECEERDLGLEVIDLEAELLFGLIGLLVALHAGSGVNHVVFLLAGEALRSEDVAVPRLPRRRRRAPPRKHSSLRCCAEFTLLTHPIANAT